MECYDPEKTTLVLKKTELGVGFALDGGKGSKYGDRPIVVKNVFAGKWIWFENISKIFLFLVGSAAKSGKISAGDELVSIDGFRLLGKTQIEAWKILKGRPEGLVQLEIRKRIAAKGRIILTPNVP